MSSNSKQYLTAQKLEEALHKIYGNQQVRVRGDLYKVLGSSQTLRALQDTFVSNNGTTQDLLVLDGTVPIQYQGAIYHIPVHVWITKSYPANAPICFVMPTKDMIVKPQHKFVNSNGEVFIPYLKDWRSDICDLYGLTIALSHAFSYEPPLFAKPPPPPAPKPQPSQPSPSQSPAQNPPSNGTSYSSSQPSNSMYPSLNSPSPNAPPPNYPYPSNYTTNGYANTYMDVTPSPQYVYVNPMPYNPQTAPTQQQPMQIQQQAPPPQPNGVQPSPQQSPVPVHPQQMVSPVMPNHIATSSDVNNSPVSHKRPVDVLDSTPNFVQSPPPVVKKTIEPKMVLTAKLQDKLSKFNEEMTDQIDFYVTNEQSLTDNEKKIQYWYSQMQQYKDEMEQYEAVLEATDMSVTDFLNANEMVEIDPDAVVATADPLTNQVLDLIAEDSAVEDTLYYLNRALESNRIDLDTYLKSYRSLSKQQFYTRSTVKKAVSAHPNLQSLTQIL